MFVRSIEPTPVSKHSTGIFPFAHLACLDLWWTSGLPERWATYWKSFPSAAFAGNGLLKMPTFLPVICQVRQNRLTTWNETFKIVLIYFWVICSYSKLNKYFKIYSTLKQCLSGSINLFNSFLSFFLLLDHPSPPPPGEFPSKQLLFKVCSHHWTLLWSECNSVQRATSSFHRYCLSKSATNRAGFRKEISYPSSVFWLWKDREHLKRKAHQRQRFQRKSSTSSGGKSTLSLSGSVSLKAYLLYFH